MMRSLSTSALGQPSETKLTVGAVSPLARLGLSDRTGRGYRPKVARSSGALAISPAKHVHQFGDLAPLLGLVAAGNGLVDAMRHVIAEHFLFEAAQRCTHS